LEKITEQEKQKAIEEFYAQQEKQYKKGKIIVSTITLLNIIVAIASAFNNFNLLTLIIEISLSIALFCGVRWVRYFFAIEGVLNAVIILYVLMNATVNIPVYYIIIAVIYMIYYVIRSIILFVSKSVSEFLYIQENG